MRRKCFALTLLIVGVGTVPLCGAQIYRWTDENGKVHYSDQAPEQGADHEEISAQVRPVNVDEGGKERSKVGKIFAPETAEEKQLKREKQLAKRQQQAQRQQRCDEARKLYRLVKDERFYMVDENGEGYDISKEEARQKRQQVEQFLRDNCE